MILLLLFKLGTRLPRVGDDRSTGSRPKVQAYLKHLFVSSLLTSHWSKQVEGSGQKSKDREVHCALHEVFGKDVEYMRPSQESGEVRPIIQSPVVPEGHSIVTS